MTKTLFVVSTALIFVAAASAQRANTRPSPIVQEWIAAWNSHDVEKVMPLFTNGVMYEDVTFGAVNHGSAELRKFASFFFEAVPDMKFELVDSSVHGHRGVIEWVFSGTDKGVYKTGKKFTVRGVSIISLTHGRISRNLDFYDAATIMRQVGLLPAAEPAKN